MHSFIQYIFLLIDNIIKQNLSIYIHLLLVGYFTIKILQTEWNSLMHRLFTDKAVISHRVQL